MIRVSYKLINLNNMKDLLYYITAFLLGITNTLCFAQQVDVSTAIETAEVFMGASVKTTGNSHLPKQIAKNLTMPLRLFKERMALAYMQ